VCVFCAGAKQDWGPGSREQVLEGLALLERPGELSRDEALRIGGRLLRWTETGLSGFRCEEAFAADPTLEAGLA
jgi:hypothetical protein